MIASLIVKRGISVRFFIYLTAGVILLAVPVLWLTPLKNAWMFLFKSDPIASTVIETQSILSYGLKDYIHDSSYLFFFTPLLLLWSIYRAKKERDFVSIITAYWLVTATVLAFTQIRLIPLLVPVFSLSLSNLLERGTKHLFKRRHPLLQKLKPVVLVIAFGVIIGLAYPSVDLFSKSERLYPSTSIRSLGEVFDSLLWIRDNTPKTDFLTEPWKKPQYGVMAPWSFGHYLNFFAERPNIANPFGWGKTHREGVFNSARFFVEDDEEKAVKLCRRLGVRFILTGEQNLLTYLHYLGIPKEDFLLQSGVDAGKVNKKYFSAMGSRLFYLNGSAANIEGFNVEALGHFRLVYESKHDSKLETTNRAKFSLVKIFEFVEGVKIHGRTTPNTEVSAKVPVLTNRNRRFEYHMRTQSNNEGYFEFYLPYSTEGNPYETGAQAPYRIQSNGKTIEITITEEEVINGAIKEVNFI
jgi:asparagine N-glycosylation enzyme membrane subunit Stt3